MVPRAVPRAIGSALRKSVDAGDRCLRCILAEKFVRGHGCRVEAGMISFRTVEHLPTRRVDLVIVLADLHVEVRDPAQFAIDISLQREFSVLRHASALHLVFVVRIDRAFRIKHHLVRVHRVFAEVLLYNKQR